MVQMSRPVQLTDIHIAINIVRIFQADHRCPNLERSPNELWHVTQPFVALCILQNIVRPIYRGFDHSSSVPCEPPFDALCMHLLDEEDFFQFLK